MHYFIFSSVHWGKIRDNESKHHGLPLPVHFAGLLFKLSTHYFGLYKLEKEPLLLFVLSYR